MRRIILALVGLLIIPALSVAQEKDKPAPPPASLAGAPLVALERQMAEAEKAHDLKFIDSTLAPDFLEIAGNGRLYTRAEIMDVVKEVRIEDYALENFRVLMPRDDLAIVSYEAAVRATYQGQSFPGRNYLSSTWRRQKNRWQMIFHTSTPIPQPPGGTAELEGLEQDLVARESDDDVAGLTQIFADDAVLVAPDGKRYSKAGMIEDIGHLPKMPRRISDVRARWLGPDSGLVTCRLEVKADDKVLPYTSTTLWHRGPGGWQVLSRQYTRLEK